MALYTNLEAVNTMIASIGQSPVPSLETGNPLVESAELGLQKTNKAIQSEGWWFNTEYAYPFPPNVDNEIEIPTNILSIDTCYDPRVDPVVMKGKLYDKIAHSFTWTKTVDLDVVWLYDFEDVPGPIQEYIVVRAANLWANNAVGSENTGQVADREEVRARAVAIEFDANQADYNIFTNASGQANNNTFRPYNTLLRY